MTLRRNGALSLLGLLALATAPAAQSDSERARQLFLTNCATCHGETGDGKGVTQLDRPARSFMDGGFSFGNTPEALFRTISVGIPGTPMPGFDSSLSEADRKVLADYVVTLGPPVEAVKEEDMILAVHDRPLIVRGLLPSLGEGLPTHPRGLLIGDPSGITFEYRVDDVRLLALRQGGFVKRTDWTGRGGTALEPLGKVVHLIEGGKPEPTFYSQGRPLLAKLSGTNSLNGTFEYHLVQDGREVAHVREHLLVDSTSFGTGFYRYFFFQAGSPGQIEVRTPSLGSAEVLARGKGSVGHELWVVARPPGSAAVFVGIEASAPPLQELAPGRLSATANATADTVAFLTLVLVDWNDGIRQQLERYWEER